VHLGTEQLPPTGPRLLLEREDMDLVASQDQPLDKPEQAGNDAVRAGSIDTARHDQGDLHRCPSISAA
jgi:hypothetical protein